MLSGCQNQVVSQEQQPHKLKSRCVISIQPFWVNSKKNDRSTEYPYLNKLCVQEESSFLFHYFCFLLHISVNVFLCCSFLLFLRCSFTYFARQRLFLKFSFEILRGKLDWGGRPKSIPSCIPDVWPQCLRCHVTFELHCTLISLEQFWSFLGGFLFQFWLFSSIGRAGRVSAGTCFRLVTREFYENALPEFGVPEMQVGSRTDSLPKSWSM